MTKTSSARLITDCRLATMVAGGKPYGLIEDAALLIESGRISFAGPRQELVSKTADRTVVDRLDGRWVTPGLIDCHTHIVFAGDRVGDFEARLTGADYKAIAKRGDGIFETMRKTRAASETELIEQSAMRLRAMIGQGLTTIEIKSGYGLDRETEIRILRTAKSLERFGIRVSTTYLGLHALPPEYRNDRKTYVQRVRDEILPALKQADLIDAVDAFLEPIAFDAEEITAFFEAASRLGVPVKLHADQLSNGKGADLAARFHALSADHLEHSDEAGIKALGEAGVVAVLLPGAFLYLRETKKPPLELLRRHGVALAVATDCNPGTSPVVSPLAAMNLACTLFGMAPEESLAGMTRNAARALGLQDEIGTLETGKRADLAVWNVSHPAELAYWLGHSPCARSYAGGTPLYTADTITSLS